MLQLVSTYRAVVMIGEPSSKACLVKLMEAWHLLHDDTSLEFLKANLAVLGIFFVLCLVFIFLEGIYSCLRSPLLFIFSACSEIKNGDGFLVCVMNNQFDLVRLRKTIVVPSGKNRKKHMYGLSNREITVVSIE